jgi:GAF domain-containing protein
MSVSRTSERQASDEALERLVDEQAALRQVATLVAQGVPPEEIFAAVSDVVGRLVGTDSATVMKFDDDGPGIIFVGVASKMSAAFPLGARWKFQDGMASADVYRTGRSARSTRDWSKVEGPVGETHHRLGIVSAVASPIVVDGRLWGAMAVQSQGQLPLDTEERLERFTELLATAIANAESRATLTKLAEEQAALRRVATLVARGVRPDEIFAAVSDEVGRLVGTDSATVVKYDDEGTGIVFVGVASRVSAAFPLGAHWKFQEGMASAAVYRTGRSARTGSHLLTVEGSIGDVQRQLGIISAVASPIVVEGRLWGAMAVHGQQPLPPDTEERVERFTELVATAIANTESRAGLASLAEEQAALRHVATLVASGAPPAELFAAVTEEAGQLLRVDSATMSRDDPDGMFTTVAAWGTGVIALPVGKRWISEGKNATAIVFETGRPARIDDFADASGAVGVAAREAGYRSAVGTPITVEGRLWGVLTAASSAEEPLPSDTEARLASFTELVATAIANAESSAGLARLAEEQAALRRVATLVAEGVPPEELFAAVSEEAGLLLGTDLAGMARYDSDDTVTVLATWSAEAKHPGEDHPLVPGPWQLEGGDLASTIWRTGRPVRIDDYHGVPGRIAAFVREELGIASSVGSPIVAEGRLWGALFVHSKQRQQLLPQDAESRLTGFTELVATAIANAESRAGLARLAEEQAALRRVATLVAEGVPPAKVLSTLCDQVNRLLDAQATTIGRLEPDGKVAVVAITGTAADRSRLGTRLELEDLPVTAAAIQTGRPIRKDNYAEAAHQVLLDMGIRSGVGVPIVVEGALWGAIATGTVRDRFPDDTEQRLEKFTELAATAIANAESRSELTASRARIVAASDETRRQIERDLHDGTQQRLVSLGLELRMAEETMAPELEEPRRAISRVAGELYGVIAELREISRGIHPAILSEGGLGPALRTLARRSAIPVELDGEIDDRLPEPIEVAAYYVVSEGLTNAAKHARASRVQVEAALQDGSLQISIHDDGVGGANPARGSGLVGLRDRVEALGGSIKINSSPGQGTYVAVRLPFLPDECEGAGRPPSPQSLIR